MTLVLLALLLLLAGSVVSLVPCRSHRLGLGAAVSAVVAASALAAAGALHALLARDGAESLTLAWPLPLGSADLALDGLAAWFVLTFALLAAPVALYSWRYLEQASPRARGVYGSLLCLLLAAMILVVVADDAVLFLVAWEAMTLCAFFLVGFHHEDAGVRRGAWIYLVATHLGTALGVVPLFALLAAHSGQTRLSAFATTGATASAGFLVGAFALGFVGFGTKAGFWPMHVWLPHAHPAAPAPMSALLSGVVLKTGIYGLLRLVTWLPGLPAGCGVALMAAGAITGVVGVLLALAQHDVKRLLAYHSVENIGIIGVGLGLGVLGQATGSPALAVLGFAGALLHVLNHALFKGLLFLSAGVVVHGAGTGEMDRLGGLLKRMPVNAALFLVGAVAICGLPPGNGFVSEWLLFGGLFRGALALPAGQAAASVLAIAALALMTGLALACFSKVFGTVFLGHPRDPGVTVRATPRSMLAAMFPIAGSCILIGVASPAVMPLVARAVAPVTGAGTGDGIGAALAASLSSMSRLSLVAGALLAAVALLALVRHLALARRGAPRADAPTWGCGYLAPTPRMALTSSSFAWPLVQLFGSVLWPRRDWRRSKAVFPPPARLETHALDVAEADVFVPILRTGRRVARMIQTVSWSGEATPVALPASGADDAADHPRGPLVALGESLLATVRRGDVQVHLALIVLALVVMFVVETVAWK